MSDDRAFSILRSRRWRPEDLHSAAQRELSRDHRVDNLQRQFQKELRDPLTLDIVGWDESAARGTRWPWCSRCKTIVRQVAVYHQNSERSIIHVECHGNPPHAREKEDHEVARSLVKWWMPKLVCFAS